MRSPTSSVGNLRSAMGSFSSADQGEQRALDNLVAKLDLNRLDNPIKWRRENELHLHGFHDDKLLPPGDSSSLSRADEYDAPGHRREQRTITGPAGAQLPSDRRAKCPSFAFE